MNEILLKEEDDIYYNPDTMVRYRLTKLKRRHNENDDEEQ